MDIYIGKESNTISWGRAFEETEYDPNNTNIIKLNIKTAARTFGTNIIA